MKFTCCKRLSAQRGSAIVMALFILVVLSLLAVPLMRLLADANRSITVEVYGTRAFLAAQSGLELGLVSLFPLDNGMGAGCLAVPASDGDRFKAQAGFVNCRVTLSCTEQVAPAPYHQTHYRIRSTAVCESGSNVDSGRVARTLEVEARGIAL